MSLPIVLPTPGPPPKTGHRRHLLRARRWSHGAAAPALLSAFVLLGCSSGATTSWQPQPMVRPATSTAAAASPPAVAARFAEVHRSPGCGCCHEWEAYLADHGFEVSAADDPDIVAFKASHGVPAMAQSCHTTLIDGYVVEGHVPIAAIEDLLSRRPAIDGIALPGMPPGSPGMDGELEGPLQVLALVGGETSPFGSY